MKNKTNKTSKISMVERKSIKEKTERLAFKPMVVHKAPYIKSIILDKISFKQKEVINMPSFSQQSHLNVNYQQRHLSVKWKHLYAGYETYLNKPNYEYKGYTRNVSFDDVIVQLDIKKDKIKKLIKLFNKNTKMDKKDLFKPSHISIMIIEIYNPNSKKTITYRIEGSIIAIYSIKGRNIAITNSEECVEFTFMPYYLIID